MWTVAVELLKGAIWITLANAAVRLVDESGETFEQGGDAAVKLAGSVLVVGVAYVAYKEFV